MTDQTGDDFLIPLPAGRVADLLAIFWPAMGYFVETPLAVPYRDGQEVAPNFILVRDPRLTAVHPDAWPAAERDGIVNIIDAPEIGACVAVFGLAPGLTPPAIARAIKVVGGSQDYDAVKLPVPGGWSRWLESMGRNYADMARNSPR